MYIEKLQAFKKASSLKCLGIQAQENKKFSSENSQSCRSSVFQTSSESPHKKLAGSDATVSGPLHQLSVGNSVSTKGMLLYFVTDIQYRYGEKK